VNKVDDVVVVEGIADKHKDHPLTHVRLYPQALNSEGVQFNRDTDKVAVNVVEVEVEVEILVTVVVM